MGTEQSDLGKYLFDTLVCMNNAYREQLECNCVQHLDDMRATWVCPRHGYREPNYQAMDALDRIIMESEVRAEGDR